MNELVKGKCPFCAVPGSRVLDSNDLGFVIADAFPVSQGHTLIIPWRHVDSFFELTKEELFSLTLLLHRAKTLLDAQSHPAGFNIGVNIGASAGQTITHTHIHLIPRYLGDVLTPQGGVRNVIPGKGAYQFIP